jgi:hypothetical protein
MRSWVDTAAAALISGTAASLAMTAALALLAKKEGKGALQPINSTSHWLHGEQASLTRSLVCPILDWGSEHIMFRHYSGHLFLRDGSQLGRDEHPYYCLETRLPCRPLLPWSITASLRKDLRLDGKKCFRSAPSE